MVRRDKARVRPRPHPPSHGTSLPATLSVLLVLILIALPFASGLASAGGGGNVGPRQTGAALPQWSIDDSWSYGMYDANVDPYPVVLVTFVDENNLPVDTVLCNYPSEREVTQVYTVEDMTSSEYTMDIQEDLDEPGVWKLRKLVAQQVRCDAGDVVAEGTYQRDDNNTGVQWYMVDNLNSNGEEVDAYSHSVYKGDLYFTITIDGPQAVSVDTPCNEWKPYWSTSPMEQGDGWQMACTETETYTEHWEAHGNLEGTADGSGTYTFIYDMEHNVTQVGQRTVKENTYPSSYRVQGSGTMEWAWEDDEGNTDGGDFNVVSDKWYADEGGYWDAGWGIDYDNYKLLEWSTFGPPIDWNSPPEVTESPPSEISIDEEEEWVWGDYAVVDDDPGACGAAGLRYSVVATYDGEEVLPGLTIDDQGVLNLTPAQEYVADGYQVVITVADSCPDAVESVDIPFTLNIKNVNDLPILHPYIISDIWMDEGETRTTDWSIYDVFEDVDMEISNLTGEQYDPLETLTYTFQDTGTLEVDLVESTGNLTITAPDERFPVNQNVTMTITARDSHRESVSDTMTVRVSHSNHRPVLLGGEDEITIEEDEDVTLDFTDYFYDKDVHDPGYLTNDNLYYFAWGKNMTIERDGEEFTVFPWRNWSGREPINLRATDMWGTRAETNITLIVEPVNDPPVLYFQMPAEEEQVLDEQRYGLPGHGHPTTMVLSVTAYDIDDPELLYNWTITDLDTGEVYDWATMTNVSMMTFRTAFKGDFEDGDFTGGEDQKQYSVKVTVTDGKETIDGGQWYITVLDVNRAPRLRDVTVSLNSKGSLIPHTETDFRNYTLEWGRVYELNILAHLTDEDSAIEDIDCKWTANDVTILSIGSCADEGAIDISAGKAKAGTVAKLRPGTHRIDIVVTDEKGEEDTLTFYLTVKSEPPSDWDNMWSSLDPMWIAIVVCVCVVMAGVGFTIAYLTTQARAERTAAARPKKVRKAKVKRPVAGKAGTGEAGKAKPVAKKRQKPRPRAEPKPGPAKVRKVDKGEERARKELEEMEEKEDSEEPGWMEDIPDDWK